MTQPSPEKSYAHPHRRYNALAGEWILVSPHRTQRPWQGRKEVAGGSPRPAYVPDCYLCPGNQRAGGAVNPKYQETFVFTNDFAALYPDSPEMAPDNDADRWLFHRQPVRGTCRVICFSPRHDLTLPQMPVSGIRAVVDVWAQQGEDLGKKYRWVQVFENKGDIMGCSNPHPHGQVWATDALPTVARREDRQQLEYAQASGSPLLVDYAAREEEMGIRVVATNDHWLLVVPFWATWPFETLLMPRRHVLRLTDLQTEERDSLANLFKRFLTRYDNLFQVSFPYSMGWHGAPYGEGDCSHWQLHAHFYPPLLRSATIKKFMVGYEMLAESQRDISPEGAAQRLRELSEVHFSEEKS